MFQTRLRISAAVLIVVGAASWLTISAMGITQEKALGPSAAREVTERTRRILSKLEKPVAMPFPNETPLDDVLKYIKQATKDGPNDHLDLPIYVDPIGLHEVKKTLTSTFTLNVEDTPLKLTLAKVLGQLGLEYAVHDEVLFISSPDRIERERGQTVTVPRLLTPKSKAVLAQLDQPYAMPFPEETPLADLLKYVTQATTTATALGIPIVVDAIGLDEVGATLQSTVSIDLEGVPLKTTLRLVLHPLGLTYTIKDGLLVISSPEVIQKISSR
jgi:hypothetical protein